MHELMYDNDVTVAGQRHTLEVYLNPTRCQAVAVFVPPAADEHDIRLEAYEVARGVVAALAPDARTVVQAHRPRRPGFPPPEGQRSAGPADTALDMKVEALQLGGVSQP